MTHRYELFAEAQMRANVGHRAISFPFGNRRSNRTMTRSATTTIRFHFLSCKERRRLEVINLK